MLSNFAIGSVDSATSCTFLNLNRWLCYNDDEGTPTLNILHCFLSYVGLSISGLRGCIMSLRGCMAGTTGGWSDTTAFIITSGTRQSSLRSLDNRFLNA